MGLIKKTFAVGIAGSAAGLTYLGATNKIITPIPASDPLWTSALYANHNPSSNPATQDICVKRIPLSKIRPELIDKPESLVLEYCRGVWSGLGYELQRRYFERKYRGPDKQEDLWTKQQLSESTYEKGTYITDHFEVVEKTPTSIAVRCGDSPRNKPLRPSDGLFVIGAVVDKEKGEVELTLKSCLFTSIGKIEGTKGPMPGWMEPLHQWYARLWSETGSRRLLK